MDVRLPLDECLLLRPRRPAPVQEALVRYAERLAMGQPLPGFVAREWLPAGWPVVSLGVLSFYRSCVIGPEGLEISGSGTLQPTAAAAPLASWGPETALVRLFALLRAWPEGCKAAAASGQGEGSVILLAVAPQRMPAGARAEDVVATALWLIGEGRGARDAVRLAYEQPRPGSAPPPPAVDLHMPLGPAAVDPSAAWLFYPSSDPRSMAALAARGETVEGFALRPGRLRDRASTRFIRDANGTRWLAAGDLEMMGTPEPWAPRVRLWCWRQYDRYPGILWHGAAAAVLRAWPWAKALFPAGPSAGGRPGESAGLLGRFGLRIGDRPMEEVEAVFTIALDFAVNGASAATLRGWLQGLGEREIRGLAALSRLGS